LSWWGRKSKSSPVDFGRRRRPYARRREAWSFSGDESSEPARWPARPPDPHELLMRLLWRYRHQLAPYYAVLVLAAVAILGHWSAPRWWPAVLLLGGAATAAAWRWLASRGWVEAHILAVGGAATLGRLPRGSRPPITSGPSGRPCWAPRRPASRAGGTCAGAPRSPCARGAAPFPARASAHRQELARAVELHGAWRLPRPACGGRRHRLHVLAGVARRADGGRRDEQAGARRERSRNAARRRPSHPRPEEGEPGRAAGRQQRPVGEPDPVARRDHQEHQRTGGAGPLRGCRGGPHRGHGRARPDRGNNGAAASRAC
jgi:hypothetical protein